MDQRDDMPLKREGEVFVLMTVFTYKFHILEFVQKCECVAFIWMEIE